MTLNDQTNHKVVLKSKVLKIVSLVPSQTELLFHLGLENETIGITKFCVHPKAWHQTKQRVGGTKKVNIELVKSLSPDLIIANKEENSQEDIETLRKSYPVYTSDILTIEDAIEMMVDIGELTDKKAEAHALISKIKASLSQLPKIQGSVLYLIWKDPYMAAGIGTFINTILAKIGLENIHTTNQRYDEIKLDEITELNPEYIFLSSEPYPFKNDHLIELRSLLQSKIILVNGEVFSWYGPKLLELKPYLETDLLPQLKL